MELRPACARTHQALALTHHTLTRGVTDAQRERELLAVSDRRSVVRPDALSNVLLSSVLVASHLLIACLCHK